jgi:hypothetical protein
MSDRRCEYTHKLWKSCEGKQPSSHEEGTCFPRPIDSLPKKKDFHVILPFAHIVDNHRTDRIASKRILVHQKVLHQKVWIYCIYGALSAFSPENGEEVVAENLFDVLLILETRNEERLGGLLFGYCTELGVCWI